MSLPGSSRRLLRVEIAVLVAAGAIVVGPFVLDTYTVNILVRAFFVAIAALTVDVLWGVSGTLTFGQSAFFGIGGFVPALRLSPICFCLRGAVRAAWPPSPGRPVGRGFVSGVVLGLLRR